MALKNLSELIGKPAICFTLASSIGFIAVYAIKGDSNPLTQILLKSTMVGISVCIMTEATPFLYQGTKLILEIAGNIKNSIHIND